MNGAELPCGSTLRVEPADPQYKQRQTESKKSTECNDDVGYYGPSFGASTEEVKRETAEVNESNANGDGGEKDDDLDDFFDSL